LAGDSDNFLCPHLARVNRQHVNVAVHPILPRLIFWMVGHRTELQVVSSAVAVCLQVVIYELLKNVFHHFCLRGYGRPSAVSPRRVEERFSTPFSLYTLSFSRLITKFLASSS